MTSLTSSFIHPAIFVHACLGTIGMISGIIAALAPKGAKTHRLSGKIFSSSMALSCLLALAVTLTPGHNNDFLQMIGFFTIYQIISGLRALAFVDTTKKPKLFWLDCAISFSVAAQGIYLLSSELRSVMINSHFNILNTTFGMLWIALSLGDFRFFYRRNPNARLHAHITKMSGALIASVTAFIVAGIGYSNLFGWMAPGLIGSVLISLARRNINRNEVKSTPAN